jgi:hypothetical protein
MKKKIPIFFQNEPDVDEVDSDTGPEADLGGKGGRSVAETIGQDDSSKLEQAMGNHLSKRSQYIY